MKQTSPRSGVQQQREFPVAFSNYDLIGFVSLPGIGDEVRIASLSGYCRVKLKSLNRKFSLTEISLFQGQDLASFIKLFHEETAYRW